MNYIDESLKRHEEWKGKIEVVSRVPVSTSEDLSLHIHQALPRPVLKYRKMLPKVMT